MSDAPCFRCEEPGHRAADCRNPKVGRSRAAMVPVVDSRAAVVPVGGESPAPAQGSARPGDWRIEGVNWRPPEDRAKDVHACAEACRRALERAGIVIDIPEYQARRHRRMALEQLAESGWISLTEYKQRLADIDKAAAERTAA